MALSETADTGFTYFDYLTWSDDERWELIDREPHAMSPEPALNHQEVVGDLFRQISNQLSGKDCRPFVAPVDVRLAEPDDAPQDASHVVQPDVFVVCDPDKLDERGCAGAPDWVNRVVFAYCLDDAGRYGAPDVRATEGTGRRRCCPRSRSTGPRPSPACRRRRRRSTSRPPARRSLTGGPSTTRAD